MNFPFADYLLTDIGLSWQTALIAMLVSFLLCHLLAGVYIWTFRGLSYSRGFAISVALTGIIATILMLAIGDNLARGLGMLGTLAMIRFRSTLRDIRDMMFIFASLSVGISAGVQAYMIGVMGTVLFSFSILHLTFSPFGLKRQFDGLLRLNMPADPACDEHLKAILKEYCSNFVLINLREISQGDRMEHAYQVKMKDPNFQSYLVNALRTIAQVFDVSLLMQDPSLEV